MLAAVPGTSGASDTGMVISAACTPNAIVREIARRQVFDVSLPVRKGIVVLKSIGITELSAVELIKVLYRRATDDRAGLQI